MPDMQKENNEKASEEEESGSMETQAPYLEGEVSGTGWEVKLVRQTEDKVTFKVFCRDATREWFQLIVRCSKERFRRIGV